MKTTQRLIPPTWDKVARHPLLPEAGHDEIARFNFLANLNLHISGEILPGVKEAFEQRAEPRFHAEHGRAPADRHEVRALMQRDPYYQWWSALRRNAMEMRQQAGRSLVLRQIDELNAVASTLNQAETLELNPELPLPRYVSAVDTHCMPGSYHGALSADDVSAGANYDCGLFITTAGLLGPYSDGGGRAIVEWLQREHPQFAPRRILDIGCTIGHNIVPIAQAFPEAEVIAIDVSAPVLRYGHARAKALGVDNIHFVQMNGEDLSRFADASFDFVTTSMFWHETSSRAMPRIMAEIARVLRPGGLTVHLEQPQYHGMSPFEQFLRDWDTYQNNEPFWGTMHEMDLTALMEGLGLPPQNQFQISIAARIDSADYLEKPVAKQEDYGRAPAWNAFGAWKPQTREHVA